MQNDESMLKQSLRRHLQGKKGQIFSYEMVRELMSFVSDMERNSPNISWMSEDSLVRLLNGIFKRVGHGMDDKTIADIEESVCSALAFYVQNERYANPDKHIKPAREAGDAGESAAPKSQTGNSAAGANFFDMESVYQRLLQELIIFENRITRTAEKSASEMLDANQRMQQEKKELASKLAAEYSALESRLMKERVTQESRLAKERGEMAEMLRHFISQYEEMTSRTERDLNVRLSGLESNMAGMRAGIEAAATEHAAKREDGASEAKASLDAYAQNLEQKLHDLEGRIAAGNRALKRLTVLVVLGLAAMSAGFFAVLYLAK